MYETFGDPRRYYSESITSENDLNDYWGWEFENKVRYLISADHIDLKKRVEQACKRSNLGIREILRSETALRISQAEHKQTVSYQVVDGIPRPLIDLLSSLPDDRTLLMLLKNKQLFKDSQSCIQLIQDDFFSILRLLGIDDSGQKSALSSSADLINRIIQRIDGFSLSDLITSIQEDVLGAYFYKIPKIQIYWMPIALFSEIIDVSIEDLSFIVLAHELAHAYTHLGLDIDGRQWKTNAFADADIMIVEGLAQFYTEVVCQKCASSKPTVIETFNKLFNKQSLPYTHFKSWPERNAAEVVRFSMILTRSNNIRDYCDFLCEMKEASIKMQGHGLNM